MRTHSPRDLALWLPFAALPLVACDEGERATPGTLPPDVASAVIIENAEPAWRDRPGWRLSDVPILSIGEVAGDSAYLLSAVNDAVRLPDGRVVVGDGGSVTLRFYDAAGRYLHRAGGHGEGPGEFQFLGRLWLHGDTLVATDGVNERISFFDVEGRFLRSMRLEMAEGRYNADPIGQFADGGFFGISGSRSYGAADAGKVIRDSLRFYSFQPDGRFRTTLAVLPSADRWGLSAGGRMRFPFVPFSARPGYAIDPYGAYLGTGAAPEVAISRRDGGVERRIRWAVEPHEVTDADVARYREALLASESDANGRRFWETFLRETPVAERFPAYQSLIADQVGNLWVEDYRPPWDDQPSWNVFDPDGAWLGTVDTPPRFEIQQIGSDFVLGISRDALGVQRVEVYGLLKPGNTRG